MSLLKDQAAKKAAGEDRLKAELRTLDFGTPESSPILY